MPKWDLATNSLSNPFFELMLEPRHGGRIVSLAVDGFQFTKGIAQGDLDRVRVPYHFGLLSLQLWQDSYWHNDLNHRDWRIDSQNIKPDKVVIALKGDSARWPGVNVLRTFEATDAPWIDVKHGLDPGPGGPTYEPPAFWFSNVLAGRGRTFAPTPCGPLEFPRFPQSESWSHEPTDGWFAWIEGPPGSGSKRHGLAFLTDLADLRHVRVCHRANDRVEWIRRRVTTKQRGDVRLVPFSGLNRVDAVGTLGIVSVEAENDRFLVTIYALQSGEAKLELGRAFLPRDRVKVFGEAHGVLTPGQTTQFSVPRRLETGWLSVAFRADRSPDKTMAFNLPVGAFNDALIGVTPVKAQVDELPRTTDKSKRGPPRSFRFDAAPVSLPAPVLSATRRLRVLAFASPRDATTLIALGRQFDLDLTLPYVPEVAAISGTYEMLLGDRFEGIRNSELVDSWKAALAPATPYDVIILEVDSVWKLFPQDVRTAILERIAGGTGLVAIRRGTAGTDPESETLNSLLPLDFTGQYDMWGPNVVHTDGTVNGLPWNVIQGFEPHVNGFALRSEPTITLAGTEVPVSERSVLVHFDYGRTGTLFPLLARAVYEGAGRVLDFVWGRFIVPPDAYRLPVAGAEGVDTLRYDLALLARAIWDAAGRQPGIAIGEVLLVGTTATITLERLDVTVDAFSIDWMARDRFGTALKSGTLAEAVFPQVNAVQLAVPSGTWTLDIVVRPEIGEPSWGAGAQKTGLTITIDPDSDTVDHDEAVSIQAAASAGAVTHLVQLLDGRKRILAQQTVPAGDAARVSFERIETASAEVRVHALAANSDLVGQGFRMFRVRPRFHWNTWPIHFWNNADVRVPASLLTRYFDAHASFGISAYFRFEPAQPNDEVRDVLNACDRLGLSYAVTAGAWLPLSQPPAVGIATETSLTDAEGVVTGTSNDKARGKAWSNTNVLYYKVQDDEPDPPETDSGFDARSVARFRIWLAETYRHADSELQREWGSTASLASADPLAYEDAVNAFNAGGQTYAPWVDHRQFITDLFSKAPGDSRAALRSRDPRARIATSADRVMAMALGIDWWTRGRAMDIVAGYDDISTAKVLEAIGTPLHGWTGYDDPDPMIRYRILRALSLKDEGLGLFGEMTIVNPDLSLPEVGRDLAAALLPILRGVGSLFAASRPVSDGVFVLVSAESSPVLAIHGYESLGTFGGTGPAEPPDLGRDAREGVHLLLLALGIGWEAISPRDLESGALMRKNARVLILPMCGALSDAACDNILRWVSAGGRLIADVLPAVFTAHGRLRGAGIDSTTGKTENSSNPLDDVFAVVPRARPPIRDTSATLPTGTTMTFRCVDTAATPVGLGSAAGESIWFEQEFDSGRTTYLGCTFFADYRLTLGKSQTDPQERTNRLNLEIAFAGLLEGHGVSSRAMVVGQSGARVGLCQFGVRVAGTIQLVSLMRDFAGIYAPTEPDSDAQLKFDESAYTYDLDNGVYLGHGDRVALHLGRYTFRAFARLPYRVLGLGVVARGSTKGDPLQVTARLDVGQGKPRGHVLRLDVIPADGHPLRYLAQESVTDCAEASFTVQTALNDPAGPWTIVVTDVATGMQGRASVTFAPMTPPLPHPQVLYIDNIDD